MSGEGEKNQGEKPYEVRQNEAMQILIKAGHVGEEARTSGQKFAEALAYVQKFEEEIPGIKNEYVNFIINNEKISKMFGEEKAFGFFQEVDLLISEVIRDANSIYKEEKKKLESRIGTDLDELTIKSNLTAQFLGRFLDAIATDERLKSVFIEESERSLATQTILGDLGTMSAQIVIAMIRKNEKD